MLFFSQYCRVGRSYYTLPNVSAPEGNSFVFPRVSLFPETKSKETLRFEGKQKNLIPDGTDIKCLVV